MKFSRENFRGALRLKHLNSGIIRSLNKYSRRNFRGTLENREKREVVQLDILFEVIHYWQQTSYSLFLDST